MITPAWRIRDAVEVDMPIIRQLFAEEAFGDLADPSCVRVAARIDNTILGACRCEQMSDGKWYVRPVAVFEVVRGQGVGMSLIKDALKLHPDLQLVAEGHVVPFYEKCGFEACSWEETDPSLCRECELCPDSESCHPLPMKACATKHTLTLLGTTSGCGVPAFFCHCLACEAARKDPSLRRGCTGALIQGKQTILIDTPPDVRHQLIREQVSDLDHVFLTHAHFDHLGGLGELEYLVRLYRAEALPFAGSSYAIDEALHEFSYMDDCFYLDRIGEYEMRTIDSLEIQALPINHCPGCYGYLITSPSGMRTFYCPDSGAFKSEVYEMLRDVDNLILDATFWHNDEPLGKHHGVKQTIEEGLDLNAKTIYLTHVAPHICNADENIIDIIEEHIKQYQGRVVLSYDGLKIDL